MIRRNIYRTVSILTCLCCCGCERQLESSVQGTVTIDGVLADHGTVAFYPAGGGAPAYGNIAKNGSYSVRVGQGNLRNEDASRIHSGEYVVTIVVNALAQNGETLGEAGPPKPGPRMTADKYATKDTSPMHVTVKPGPNIVPLEFARCFPGRRRKGWKRQTQRQNDTDCASRSKARRRAYRGGEAVRDWLSILRASLRRLQ